jgi:hypothetical protein
LGCGFFPDTGINQAQIAWRQDKQILSKKVTIWKRQEHPPFVYNYWITITRTGLLPWFPAGFFTNPDRLSNWKIST